MSPSALSHVVGALEERIGVRLFHRTTRSVSLSEAGELFLDRIRPALRDIDLAMDAVNDFRERPTGTLRLNASEGAARMVLAPYVFEYMRRFPDMKVDIVTEGRLVEIVADGFDAGIRSVENVPQDMIAVRCSPAIRFTVVGSPGYFSRYEKPRTPADLMNHRCIRSRYPSGSVYKWEFGKNGDKQTIDVVGALTLDNHNLMIEAALHDQGLAWTSEWATVSHVAEHRLIRVLEDWCQEEPGLCIYYPNQRHVTAGLRAFVDMVKEIHKSN